MLQAFSISHHLEIFILCIIVLIIIYVYFREVYSYWKRKGVPTPKPFPPLGNFTRSFLTFSNPRLQVSEIYKEFKDERIIGLYSLNKPLLLLKDPQLIKQVLTKDFINFHSRGFETNEKVEPLQGHLFALSGTKWRTLRMKITPIFSTGKLKMMFNTLLDKGIGLQECLRSPAANKETVDILDIVRRYGIDVVASCVYGIESNSLEGQHSEFKENCQNIFKVTKTVRLIRTITSFIPLFSKMFNFKLFPPEASAYFINMVRGILEYREANNIHRNDFMQLMIQLKNKKLNIDGENEAKSSNSFELTPDVIAAQAFLFFLGGFETSSTTTALCLYELAMNPDIQARVQAEIDSVMKKNGELTYQGLQEMKYMDKAVNETLRKYPPVIGLTRHCTGATTLGDTNLAVEKDMQIQVSIMALHHDPKYYPNPDKFDPERFSEKEKNKRPHSTFIPFGDGPRICIGMRFAYMQVKSALASLLSKYQFQVSEQTPMPVTFDKKSFVFSLRGEFALRVVDRSF